MNAHKYPYSKANGWFYTIFTIACACVAGYAVAPHAKLEDYTWLLFMLPMAFLLMMIWVLVKKLIPALRGDIALEVNSAEIISYLENVTIEMERYQINRLRLWHFSRFNCQI